MIQKAIQTRLLSLVGSTIANRVFPIVLPQSSTYPCVIHRQVSCPHLHNLDGAAGVATARYQIDCWSPDYIDCLNLAESIRLGMDGFSGIVSDVEIMWCHLNGEYSLTTRTNDGSDMLLYQQALDYSIKFRLPIPTFS